MDTESLQAEARRLCGFLAAEASRRHAQLDEAQRATERIDARLAATLCAGLGPQAKVCLDEGLLWALKEGTQAPYESLLEHLPALAAGAELLLGHMARFSLLGQTGFAAAVGLRAHGLEVASVALCLPETGELVASTDRAGDAFLSSEGELRPYSRRLRSEAAREPGTLSALNECMAALALARIVLLQEERSECLLAPGSFAASTYTVSVFTEGLGLDLSRLDGSPLHLDPGRQWPPTLARLVHPSSASSRLRTREPEQARRAL